MIGAEMAAHEDRGGRYFTVAQVADLLGLSPETVRRFIRDGRLHGYRIGGPRGRLRVDAADVTALLRSTQRRPIDGPGLDYPPGQR